MSGSSNSGDTESDAVGALVEAAASGNRSAQDRLLRGCWPTIQRIVRGRLRRGSKQLQLREGADDLDQEAALHLLTELPQHAWRGRRSFIAWVKRVCDNHIRDLQRHHRAARRDRAAETGEDRGRGRRPVHSPESVIDLDRRVAKLRSQLDQIKPEYAAAVELNSMGYTHAEVGELLGCSAEAARKLVARGMSRLQGLRRP